jgi:hypothetical protein
MILPLSDLLKDKLIGKLGERQLFLERVIKNPKVLVQVVKLI